MGKKFLRLFSARHGPRASGAKNAADVDDKGPLSGAPRSENKRALAELAPNGPKETRPAPRRT